MAILIHGGQQGGNAASAKSDLPSLLVHHVSSALICKSVLN